MPPQKPLPKRLPKSRPNPPRQRLTSQKLPAKKSPLRRFLGGLAWRVALLVAVLLSGYLAWVDLSVRAKFDPRDLTAIPEPARLYARPLELRVGKILTADAFDEELSLAGYHQEERLNRPGSYRREGRDFSVMRRPFGFWDGQRTPGDRIEVGFDDSRLKRLGDSRGRPLASARIEPALIGRIYPSHQEDRILLPLDRFPKRLIEALIAVEDRAFYRHFGISLRAIARAAYENFKSGATVQGGSTLTQQLVKNHFLGPERSLVRKFHEAAFSLFLEMRYEKDEILVAYLNEVYLGHQGRRSIRGFGSAAHFYFHRPLAELRLSEVALLVALARGASYYNPRGHPTRALDRRNLVIDVMAEWGYISEREAIAARSDPLGITETPPAGATPFPAFVGLVRRQIAEDYHLKDLRAEGLRVFTTLDIRAQRKLEGAIGKRLVALEWEKEMPMGQLQAAAVVSEIATGKVLALAGGRDPRMPGFNRALHAVRPVGSLIKPAIYLSALEPTLRKRSRYTLASPLSDHSIRLRGANGKVWTPGNYDGKTHGRVPLITALAKSYNLATVKLGMSLGLSKVLRALKRLGVERRMPPYPATLLGAGALSPLEITRMYQTIADGGRRRRLLAVLGITDAQGRPLREYDPSVTRAFDPGPVFLLTHALQATMRTGTGRGIYTRFPKALGFAGKTGTTNDLRDSWFAGFDRDRLAVVWVGRDDNRPVGITGAGGALALWGDFMAALGPRARSATRSPPGIEWHWTDLHRGVRTDSECGQAEPIPYLAGSAPGYMGCAWGE
uniref:Penicillin-binding protein 1B n=1 Tax=Candidatus Kentrum eta TaxID=2126337 RepID=A0A450UBK5_9GAMM|nr:MAG: penicillin-binding protein 1B [Candidatus Kentron sp. H]VFJ89515.1 MAG: penicillin-binding protein 1B [Candidatus Kentron sp. H]VFJ96203.1 MAG: penicillin-binding protein 1B [Candidatus Kentron sp. H]